MVEDGARPALTGRARTPAAQTELLAPAGGPRALQRGPVGRRRRRLLRARPLERARLRRQLRRRGAGGGDRPRAPLRRARLPRPQHAAQGRRGRAGAGGAGGAVPRRPRRPDRRRPRLRRARRARRTRSCRCTPARSSTRTASQLGRLAELGFSRAILARELSLDEIAALDPHGLELEAFVHGALCYGYSGDCLLSSMARRPQRQPRPLQPGLPPALPADAARSAAARPTRGRRPPRPACRAARRRPTTWRASCRPRTSPPSRCCPRCWPPGSPRSRSRAA